MTNGVKTCKTCNITENETEFVPNRWMCKKCHSMTRRDYYLTNPDKFPNKYQKTGVPVGRPKKSIDVVN
jgi:hypothetical protein